MSVLEDLKRNRQQSYDLANAIATLACTENRSLSGSEQHRFNELTADIDRYDERIKEVAGQQDREQRAEDKFAALRGHPKPAGPGAMFRSEADKRIADEFRSMLLERNPRPIDVHWEQPRSMFQPGLEKRDLVTTAPANMSQVSFYGQLVEHMVESSAVLRAGATLLTTDSGESLRVPRTSALSTAGIVSEAAAIPESDPTLSSITLGSFKYGFLVQVSTELVQDSGVDLPGYLSREAGQAIGLGLGNHLVNGTGSGQPRGILLDSTLGVTLPAGTATSFGSQGDVDEGTDALLNLYGSVAEPYAMAPAAGWMLRSATLTAVRKLKTATQGDPVGSDFVGDPPAGSGASASMVGLPAYIDPFMPAMANAAKSTIFGDFSRYFVRMVNGIRFERSDDYAFANDLVTFRALLRADGALVDTTGAIKHLVHTT